MTAERVNYVQEHFKAWTGVLRLWKCEGWQSGNGKLTGWLNACIEQFEKRHPGVYVQLTDVSEEAIADFMNVGVNPPDLILYAPGMLAAPYSLMQMENEMPIRGSMQALGLWQEARYAVPIALGGYAMAVNSQLLPEAPENWSALAPIEKANAKAKKAVHLLNAPRDSAFTCWSAALISMFAGSYAPDGAAQEAPVGDGIDLGLPVREAQTTAPPVVSDEERRYNALPGELPEDFGRNESVYSQFVNGEIAAMPITQREARRLSLLSEAGKAPDWRAEAMGMPFTDQIALVSVVACGSEDESERQAFCMELIQLMLTAEMQSKLTISRVFPVIELPPLYTYQAGMKEIEQALSEEHLLTPPAFGDEWREYAARLREETGAGEETQEAHERLREMLSPY